MKNFVGVSLFSAVLLFGSVSTTLEHGNNIIKPIRDIENQGSLGKSGRIINGQAATDGQFPYQLFVTIRTTAPLLGLRDYAYCGGSIISTTFAMTAGHCYLAPIPVLQTVSYKLDAGMIVRNTPRQSTIVQQGQATLHPNYNSNTLENDVALLRFTGLTFNTYVGSIGIATTAWNTLDRYAGQSVRVSGFGYISNNGPISPILYWIMQNGIPYATCQAAYSAIPTTCFCAYDTTNGGRAICSGDSGGPITMMIPGTQTPIQIGIVSFGSSGGCDTAPQGYTNVAAMYAWIISVTGPL
ncbi:hypothetical protein DMENIID0001_127650 [Sergentomyia squamirostris]